MPSRILLVEDDELLRHSLARLLQRIGFEVEEAENGRVALRCMAQQPADLVVTDMLMPEMEGVETILSLRRQYPAAKIIAISGGGRSSAEMYLKIARLLGTHRVMTKPLGPREFIDAVRTLIPGE